ncbi:hypothetical protein BDC45DRAFT_542349 [Circinella umbellata]|nr:hypothetical protein BDC45DRAFT_542349 [Circinella umbellata]
MDSSLPPIIIEFQQNVNNKFMKQAVGYCIQADKRFEVDPILLVICINSLCIMMKNNLNNCNNLTCNAAPYEYWVDRCYIVDENSIKNHTASNPGLDSNLDPFTTYCLFRMRHATSIDLAPMKENTTTKMLYNISQIAYAKCLEKNASVIEELNKQYKNVLTMLTDDSLPRSTIKEYTSQSLQDSIQQKRKLDMITSEDYLSEEQYLDKPIEIEDALHEYMNFVELSNEKKYQNGLEALLEGRNEEAWLEV